MIREKFNDMMNLDKVREGLALIAQGNVNNLYPKKTTRSSGAKSAGDSIERTATTSEDTLSEATVVQSTQENFNNSMGDLMSGFLTGSTFTLASHGPTDFGPSYPGRFSTQHTPSASSYGDHPGFTNDPYWGSQPGTNPEFDNPSEYSYNSPVYYGGGQSSS